MRSKALAAKMSWSIVARSLASKLFAEGIAASCAVEVLLDDTELGAAVRLGAEAAVVALISTVVVGALPWGLLVADILEGFGETPPTCGRALAKRGTKKIRADEACILAGILLSKANWDSRFICQR